MTSDPALGALLVRAAERAPDHEALVVGERRCTAGELLRDARATACSLVGLGVAPGARVGVLMANTVRFVTTVFGIGLAGGVVVPLDTRHRVDDLGAVLVSAGLAVVVTSDDTDAYLRLADVLAGALDVARSRGAPLPTAVLAGSGEGEVPEGVLGPAALVAAGDRTTPDDVERRWRAVRPGDPGLVFHTSGTTAEPRAVTHSQDGYVRLWRESLDRMRLREGSVLWSPLPLTHISGLGPLTACLRRGATYVTDVGFDPGRALAVIRAERPTVLYPAFPPLIDGVLDAPGRRADDLDAARSVLVVGPAETLQRIAGALPHAVLHSTYGLTEAGGPVCFARADQDLATRTTTCGPPLRGVEVVVDEGVPVAPGTEGEIRFRDGDGPWVATGDRGVLDAEGNLAFRGRADDRLKVGGENVAPAEVEARLTAHPGGRTAQVVGAPDARLGEVVAAFVELEPGADTPPSAEDLIAHCRGRLAGYKVPGHVRVVTEWPLSATKIQKFRLRERIAAELATGP